MLAESTQVRETLEQECADIIKTLEMEKDQAECNKDCADFFVFINAIEVKYCLQNWFQIRICLTTII